jgi:hypothetical protein
MHGKATWLLDLCDTHPATAATFTALQGHDDAFDLRYVCKHDSSLFRLVRRIYG